MFPSPRTGPAVGPTVGVDTGAGSQRQAAAAAVVAEAVALALEAVAAEAAEAVVVTAAAVSQAACRAADAAETARGARAFAAAAASRSVVREAQRTAARVRRHADVAEATVHQAASLAADELARSIEGGIVLDPGNLTTDLAATVRAAADATVETTKRAASAVRKADLATAARVAQALAAAEEALEGEVAAAAEAQRELAAATAMAAAHQTDARAAGVAIAAREAAAALLTDEPTAGIRTDEVVAAAPGRVRLEDRPFGGSQRRGLDERHAIEPADELRHDHLRFLVDAVTECAIITLDLDGIVESWNTGAERLKGYTSEEALGRHFSIFYTAEDRATELPQRLLDRARAEGSYEHTGWRVRNDGSQFWGDIIISALRDETGNLTGFVKVTRDLTEQHQLEVAQDSFYHAFEHDVRVPITAIKGFAALIGDADLEDQEFMVERIDSNANRLLTMVDELVDYARLRSGLIPINLQTVDMKALAERAVANLASIAETRRVHVSAATSVEVLADPAALERVIANLVTNALKYSPTQSVVDLICERVGDVGVLRILDQGRGIDERDLGSIFLEFERGRLAKDDDSGTGLGLASVRRLVGLQSGTVAITSQVKVGTTVTIQLPLAP